MERLRSALDVVVPTLSSKIVIAREKVSERGDRGSHAEEERDKKKRFLDKVKERFERSGWVYVDRLRRFLDSVLCVYTSIIYV